MCFCNPPGRGFHCLFLKGVLGYRFGLGIPSFIKVFVEWDIFCYLFVAHLSYPKCVLQN